VIGVKGNLETLNITVFGEVFLKFFRFHVIGDLFDEKVVINESLGVGTEKLIVEGEGSARAAIDFEISENLASLLELFRVRNLNDGCVEGFIDISLNLGNTFEFNASFFKKLRNLD